MSESVLADILHAIQQVSRGVQFSESGTIDPQDPRLEIDGVGSVKLPLRPMGVRDLLAAAQKAPYGKGTKTLIDTSVRDSLEVSASKISLAESWNASVQSAARAAAERLGLPANRIEAKLYKLLIYQKGGFFLPHRDSEKQSGMVGSLIVVLPSSFGGGELVVEHGGSKATFAFEQAANGQRAEYVAFYADCRHEVRKVTRGVRVCLAYNLIVKPPGKGLADKEGSEPDSALVAAVSHWVRSRPVEPLVFALEHQYTAAGLKPALLKGNDRVAAKHLSAAAEAADCRIYFGQVARHLVQFADEGSFGRQRYWSAPSVDISKLKVGETYDDEVRVDGWRDAQGKRVSMGALPLDGSTLVSTIPFEQWKPTSQDYEGYTGNAGNTLDRWYHKSAVVLWASQRHFDVLVKMGREPAVETLRKMRKRLSRLSGDKLEQASRDCQSLARAIIQAWPNRVYRHGRDTRDDSPGLTEFAAELPEMGDTGLVGEFLLQVALRDGHIRLNQLILKSCRRFGAEAMFPILQTFLATRPEPNRYGQLLEEGLPPRDSAWLCHVACDRKMGGMTADQLSNLLQVATNRFGEHLKTVSQDRNRHHGRPGEFDDALAGLLKAELAVGDENAFAQLLELRRSVPGLYDVRVFDVKVCTDLIAWADKRFDERPSELARWLAETRQFLQDATLALPRPPADWSRPSEIDCVCTQCRQLADFLKDPDRQSGSIQAKKDALEHVEHQIIRSGLDAKKKLLDRSTRPFTLTLIKTNDSHERAVKRYHADEVLLRSLP